MVRPAHTRDGDGQEVLNKGSKSPSRGKGEGEEQQKADSKERDTWKEAEKPQGRPTEFLRQRHVLGRYDAETPDGESREGIEETDSDETLSDCLLRCYYLSSSDLSTWGIRNTVPEQPHPIPELYTLYFYLNLQITCKASALQAVLSLCFQLLIALTLFPSMHFYPSEKMNIYWNMPYLIILWVPGSNEVCTSEL